MNVPFQLQVDSLSIFFIRLDPTALRLFCREESRCVASEKACERDIGNSFRTHCFVLSLLASIHLHLIYPLGVFATAKHTKTGNKYKRHEYPAKHVCATSPRKEKDCSRLAWTKIIVNHVLWIESKKV